LARGRRARRRRSDPHNGDPQVRTHYAVEEKVAPDLGLAEARGGRPIAKEGLKLSAQWMKRSFDGIHVGYLGPIKKNAPQDYQRILDWFPLVEAEVWRHERAGLV